MSGVIVVGCQFGDEGKGKIVHKLASEANVVVRFAGGNNAGHTVVVNGEEYKLHLIPSAIPYENIECIIANGVVIDFFEIEKEFRKLTQRGISLKNLYISNRAHLILPTHIIRDNWSERSLKNKIGTTGRGIGPTYTDKIARIGMRISDILSSTEEELTDIMMEHGVKTGNIIEGAAAKQLSNDLKEFWTKQERIIDTSKSINDSLDAGRRVLFEGAQGLLLDVDHGTYPYVTSSNPSAGGVCTGAGVGPSKINHTLGVAKAYTTRVGEGPFPTELNDDIAKEMRTRGNEFGTTTGRPRRCGWLDLVALKYATMINGLDSIAITKVDILDVFEEIKVCVDYEIDNKIIKEFPASCRDLEKVKPIYKTFSGWLTDTSKMTRWPQLPKNLINYLDFIADSLNVPIIMVGVGADFEQVVGGKCFWESI